MPPRIEEIYQPNLETTQRNVVPQETANLNDIVQSELRPKTKEVELSIRWRNVAIMVFLHLGAIYGLYLCFFCKWQTLLFAYVLFTVGRLGITAGAHRLWSHRTYKAKLPLRILLGIFQTIALQNSIFEWSRDHRVHHKHAETDADPHNAKRGFFFSHVGWLLMKKHPDVITKGSKIPLNDLLNDPVVYYQNKFYKPLAIFACFIMPTLVPLLWGESIHNAYFVPAIMRYIATLHVTWLVNSVAHMWGEKPYDKNINPVENLLVSIGAIGEGFHNYHHTFPQDYATSEYGILYFNLTKGFIDFFALIGQAYDRNKVSKEMVLARRKRTGDLSIQKTSEYDVSHEHDY